MSGTIYSYEAPFLRAALQQGKSYLLSTEIFWNLGLKPPPQHPPYPQLSLGNILLSFTRLVALRDSGLLADQQIEELNGFESALGSLRNSWQTAWTGKAEKGFGVRLRQWARFLDDLSESARGESNSFESGLRNRAILQLLIHHLPPAEISPQSELALQDQRLKQLSNSGGFIWENELEVHFSRQEYFFLYAHPKQLL